MLARGLTDLLEKVEVKPWVKKSSSGISVD